MICGVLIKSTEKPNTIYDFKEHKLLTISVLIIIKDQLSKLVANCDRLRLLKHSSVYPLVFTEKGFAMLSSVLRSEKAILLNIEITVRGINGIMDNTLILLPGRSAQLRRASRVSWES